jgi:branched-chain amino acid transport system permease protein
VTDVVQVVLNGLNGAALYALLAVGVTLVFGLTGVVNFAQGQLMMLGGFVTWSAADAGANYFVALGAGVAAMGLGGFVLERGLFRFTLQRPITGFIVSLGLIPVIEVVALKTWGADARSVIPPLDGVWVVSNVFILQQRMMTIAVAALVVAVFFVLLKTTHVGRALRAGAQDREMTALMGVNTRQLVLVTFVVGSAIAGLAGGLLVAQYPVDPYIGGIFIFKAFAVALIGGLGSVNGAVIAALIVGLAEAFLARYVASVWTDAYVLLLMVLILMVRPSGIIKGTEGSAVT